VDCSLQQTSVTQTGTIYPYKAYIDTLQETGGNDRVLRDSQLFEKDSPGNHDDADMRNGANDGLCIRSMYTDEGRFMELEGPLHLDVFSQKRLIVNGISLTLKLWPSKNAFRLMSSEEGAAYAVQILDASFKLCLQKPNAGVLMAHSKLLANGTAMYRVLPQDDTHFRERSLILRQVNDPRISLRRKRNALVAYHDLVPRLFRLHYLNRAVVLSIRSGEQ